MLYDGNCPVKICRGCGCAAHGRAAHDLLGVEVVKEIAMRADIAEVSYDIQIILKNLRMADTEMRRDLLTQITAAQRGVEIDDSAEGSELQSLPGRSEPIARETLMVQDNIRIETA